MAETYRGNNEYERALEIYRALAEAIRENLGRVDDSSGHYGRRLESAIDAYAECVREASFDHETVCEHLEYLYGEYRTAEYRFGRGYYDDALREACPTADDLEYLLSLVQSDLPALDGIASGEATATDSSSGSDTPQVDLDGDVDTDAGLPDPTRWRLEVELFTGGELDVDHLGVGPLEVADFVGETLTVILTEPELWSDEDVATSGSRDGAGRSGQQLTLSVDEEQLLSTYLWILSELEDREQRQAVLEDVYTERSEFYRQYVDVLRADGQNERAREVIEDGLAEFTHSADVHRLAAEFYQGRDDERYREILRTLFVRFADWDAYDDLRSVCSAEEWESVSHGLRTQLGRIDPDRLIDLSVREDDLETAFDRVLESDDLETLRQYRDSVAEVDPETYFEAYRDLLEPYLAADTGRDHYRTVIEHLREVTSSPVVNDGASHAVGFQPCHSSWTTGEISSLEGRERHLAVFRPRLAVGCGPVTGAPIPWRVIAFRFPGNALTPRIDAASDVRRGVDIGLERRYVALAVRTPELGLFVTAADVTARVAGLRGVRRLNVFDRNASLECLVLDPALQSSKRPCVKPPIHVRAVIQVLADVRQVLECDHRVVELPGVLDGFPRRLFDDIRERVLVVAESLVESPLGDVALLQAFQRRVHLLAEVSRSTTVDQQRRRRCGTLQDTARNQRALADIETDVRRIVTGLWFIDRVLDGDVQGPCPAVLLQTKFTRGRLTLEQVAPQRFLLGIDPQRNPEVRPTTGLRDLPDELVVTRFVAVEFRGAVDEPYRVIVREVVRTVGSPKLRNVGFERVFRLVGQVVRRHDIVDRRHRIRARIEGVVQRFAIGVDQSLEQLLFPPRRADEPGFQRFRHRRGHSIPYTSYTLMCFEQKVTADDTPKHHHRGRTGRVDSRESHQPLEPRPRMHRAETTGIRRRRLTAVASESDAIPVRPEGRDSLAV